MFTSQNRNLLGIHQEVDFVVRELAYQTVRHADFHPANAGDVSQVLSEEAGKAILSLFAKSTTDWVEISQIQKLGNLRNDGRQGYRAEGIQENRYYQLIRPMARKLLIITRTGADLPGIQHTVQEGRPGELLVVLEVNESADAIRIVYGNQEYGSIPSIESHIHILANAISIAEGEACPAMVHAHPFNLLSLTREKHIKGDSKKFNAAIYTQIEGINRNCPGLIGVIPYYESGSSNLVINSMEALVSHHLVSWMNHGFVVRASNISRGYTLMAYAEDSARSAIDSLRYGSIGLPLEVVSNFLDEKGLREAYIELFG